MSAGRSLVGAIVSQHLATLHAPKLPSMSQAVMLVSTFFHQHAVKETSLIHGETAIAASGTLVHVGGSPLQRGGLSPRTTSPAIVNV